MTPARIPSLEPSRGAAPTKGYTLPLRSIPSSQGISVSLRIESVVVRVLAKGYCYQESPRARAKELEVNPVPSKYATCKTLCPISAEITTREGVPGLVYTRRIVSLTLPASWVAPKPGESASTPIPAPLKRIKHPVQRPFNLELKGIRGKYEI